MVPCTALHLHSRAPCALPAPHRGSPIRALRRLSRMGCLAPPPPPHLAALLFRAPRRLSVSGASGPGALHPAVHTAALLSTHCGAYTACGALRHPCTSRLSPHVVPCITPAPRDSPIPRTAAPIREWCCTRLRLCPCTAWEWARASLACARLRPHSALRSSRLRSRREAGSSATRLYTLARACRMSLQRARAYPACGTLHHPCTSRLSYSAHRGAYPRVVLYTPAPVPCT